MKARKTINRMKWCSVAGILLIAAALPALSQKHPSELGQPESIQVRTPDYETFMLPGGITVYYVEHDSPIIHLNSVFKGGALTQPSGKAGLADLTAAVMRSGGTAEMAGDDIVDELDYLAATVSVVAQPEFFVASMTCLDRHFARVLRIYADTLIRPAFPQDKIDLEKELMRERIRMRWENPRQMSGLLFESLVYGFDHPEVRRPTLASLKGISREDILLFHRERFLPNNMYLVVAANLPLPEAKTLLNNAFRGWEEGILDLPAVPPVKNDFDKRIFYVDIDGPQAHLYMGHLGVNRNDPDLAKITVMNNILGRGGLTTRLNQELRTKRGFTYGITGGMWEGRDRGVFRINSSLKAEHLGESLDVIRAVVEDLQNNVVEDEELEEAKDSLANRAVFMHQQARGIVFRRMMDEQIFGREFEELGDTIEKYLNVTGEDVREMARKHIDLDNIIMVVVGDRERFDKSLENYGDVVEITVRDIMEKEGGTAKSETEDEIPRKKPGIIKKGPGNANGAD